MIEISNKVYYVGVNDRNKNLFEGLWPLPNGVSYNSYLIDDDLVCLIDTVEVDFFTQCLENIHEVIGDRPIDYIVINHMEPDHSGSLALMKKYYPNAKIVGNKKTFGMMQGFYGIGDNQLEVKNGDSLELGHHTLNFVLTPMVHWPETMVTLDSVNNILFSGDAFGCFGALNGGVIDSEINCDTFWLEMVRYYSNIVGKYGVPVQNALKKLAGVKIDYICATHGPVWHDYIDKVVGMYDQMSKYETEPGLVICYGTMYGNTERMAEVIARAASQEGLKNIVIYNVSKTHHSYIIRDIFRYGSDTSWSFAGNDPYFYMGPGMIPHEKSIQAEKTSSIREIEVSEEDDFLDLTGVTLRWSSSKSSRHWIPLIWEPTHSPS